MPTLSHTAFEARIERITRKQGYKMGLALIFLIVAIVINQRLKARNTTNWLGPSQHCRNYVHIM